MIRFYNTAVILLFLLATAHTIISFVLYPGFSLEFFWFFGTGIALYAVAALNYINSHVKADLISKVTVALNIMVLAFSVVLAVMFRHIPGTLVAIITLCMLYCNFRLTR